MVSNGIINTATGGRLISKRYPHIEGWLSGCRQERDCQPVAAYGILYGQHVKEAIPMEFIRITAWDDARLKRSLAHYATSFPAHEQRSPASQAAILSDSAYHYCLISADDREVGAILYWEMAAFVYVEHFFINPTFRGCGYGGAALAKLCRTDQPVILEIDPPADAVSVRRRAFYERCGFAVNPYPHVHPPYRAGNAGHALTVMSYPGRISQALYDEFFHGLITRVMAGAVEAGAPAGRKPCR